MIREAIRKQERSLLASADKFVPPKDQRGSGTWDVEKAINKLPDLMIPTRQRKVMPASTTTLRPRTKTRGKRLQQKILLPIFEANVKSKTKEMLLRQ